MLFKRTKQPFRWTNSSSKINRYRPKCYPFLMEATRKMKILAADMGIFGTQIFMPSLFREREQLTPLTPTPGRPDLLWAFTLLHRSRLIKRVFHKKKSLSWFHFWPPNPMQQKTAKKLLYLRLFLTCLYIVISS